jgi:hypothetical protein
VYLLFVVVFVVIGIAIMFRVRIDPRTVMTIQNQIPKIIIGILLVTFSFAIAGFLIDLMYVVIFLSYELISGAVTGTDFSNLNPLTLQGQTAIGAAGNIGNFRGILGIMGIASTTAEAMTDIINNLFAFNDPTSASSIIIALISGVVGGFMGIQASQIELGGIFGWEIPGAVLGIPAGVAIGAATDVFIKQHLPYIIIFLVIFIALFFALIRLWFSLIIAYVSILIDVVFAPFWIAATLLPGSSIGFGAWLRSIIANLAAFPATIIMFLLAKAFIDGFGSTQTSNQFVPPLIGNPGTTDAIGSLIGLGIILMTHNVVHLVKAALKAPTTPFGAIGAAMGVGAGTVTSPFKFVTQVGTSAIGYKLASRIKLPKFLGGEGKTT